MNKTIIGIAVVVLVALGVGGYFFMNMSEQVPPSVDESIVMEQKTEDTMVKDGDTDDTMMVEEDRDVAVFEVDGFNFEFSITDMTVEEGQTVRIVFTNTQGFHDWVLDEFDAATAQIAEGESETIEFVADKAGEYEYYCSVGNHREQGMVGTLTVTPSE